MRLQGANLERAHLQGADLNNANLQGANLKRANLHGIDWTGANLDGIFLIRNPESEANNALVQQNIETELKPLLSNNRSVQFQQRMKRAINQLPPSGEPSTIKACYSDNPTLLKCEYHLPKHLKSYRSTLHTALIELACSDAEIAEGVAKRSIFNSFYDASNLNLATALLKKVGNQKLCEGLTALNEQTRQQLRDTAKNKPQKLNRVGQRFSAQHYRAVNVGKR